MMRDELSSKIQQQFIDGNPTLVFTLFSLVPMWMEFSL
jgi:hypothetical protein